MSKFEEIDNNHREAALAEKVKFATQSLNRLHGRKIHEADSLGLRLEIVKEHADEALSEIARIQERLEFLRFLEDDLDKKLTKKWLSKFEHETNS